MGPEEDENQASKSPEDGAAGPVGGERLAAIRRERGISVLEIAKELHLDEPKVRALEENRFEVLGAPVFAKGHLRKYAILVGVSVDDVIADYYQLNRSAGAPPVVGPRREDHRDIPVGLWVAGIVVILVIAIAALWWANREPAADPATVEPATLAPFESERQDDATKEVEFGSSLVVSSAAIESYEQVELSSVTEDAQVAVAKAMPEPDPVMAVGASDDKALAGGSVEVMLSFIGDCWTEVTDATGRRLYLDLATDGRFVTLSGVGPLDVLLGNTANVSIQVNGFDYSIPTASRRGATARLTIHGH